MNEERSGESRTRGPVRRAEARYEGAVQNVGFRITTMMLSRRHEVSGYVLNEDDGSVRVVVEGTEAEIGAFLRAIKGSVPGRGVQREDVSWALATGEFDRFDIRG